jgi:hypothetical protein
VRAPPLSLSAFVWMSLLCSTAEDLLPVRLPRTPLTERSEASNQPTTRLPSPPRRCCRALDRGGDMESGHKSGGGSAPGEPPLPLRRPHYEDLFPFLLRYFPLSLSPVLVRCDGGVVGFARRRGSRRGRGSVPRLRVPVPERAPQRQAAARAPQALRQAVVRRRRWRRGGGGRRGARRQRAASRYCGFRASVVVTRCARVELLA